MHVAIMYKLINRVCHDILDIACNASWSCVRTIL